MKSSLITCFHLVSLAFTASIFSSFWNKLPQQLLSIITDDDHELISLHKAITEIESITGNEFEVGQYLSNYLISKGYKVELQEVAPKRNNVYAYKGESKDAKVLLTSHIDTVPPYFPYYVEGEDIYGRGSNDAKASVAAQIIAVLELANQLEENESQDVALLYVVGEEVDGSGMIFASENLDANWEHVIFGEPTELKLGVGHKGVLHFDIEITGKAAHSGYPQLGINANIQLVNTLHKILNAEYPSSELLGNSTINPGLISGGVAGNVISPYASSKILIRVASDTAKVHDIVKSIVNEANEELHNLEFIATQVKEPVLLDHEVPGFETTVLAYFTDVSNLKKPVKSKYLYGPGSVIHAHTSDEHVSLDDLRDSVKGYKDLVRYLLNK